MAYKNNSPKTGKSLKKKSTGNKSQASKKNNFSNKSSAKKIRANLDSSGDPYIPKEHRKDYTICESCHIVYHYNRWYKDEKLFKALKNNPDINRVICPACKKIKENYPMGIISIKGHFFDDHEQEILNLVKNEEVKAIQINPLERIMKMKRESGNYVITTTSEKLAQKIGRALHKAYKGEVKYSWSEENKFIRVFWERDL